jgi:hypothetical protein
MSELRLTPSDRFLLLAHVIEAVPEERGGELLRTVARSCTIVVRHLEGRATEAEARFELARARRALLEAVDGAVVDQEVADVVSRIKATTGKGRLRASPTGKARRRASPTGGEESP